MEIIMKNREYRILLSTEKYEDGTVEYIASYPDLEGIIGVGNSYEEAVKEAEIFKNILLDDMDKNKIEYPKNSQYNSLSGRVTLRISKSLHERSSIIAQLEEVSLNQLINEALANYIGKIEYSNKLEKDIEKVQEAILHMNVSNIGVPVINNHLWSEKESSRRNYNK